MGEGEFGEWVWGWGEEDVVGFVEEVDWVVGSKATSEY